MIIQEHVNIGVKTTMRIGGKARFYVEAMEKQDVEDAWRFAQEKKLPLIVLGGGANTVFADGMIDALVLRIAAANTVYEGSVVTVEAGKILATLVQECAQRGLDLSALTGIPGSLGGALYGNAGQGPKGTWIDSFVESVTVFTEGSWQTLPRNECGFTYRESAFKHMANTILWETVLHVPARPAEEVQSEIQRLLQKRLETQPHVRTAGSCFKALSNGTPAWTLIDAAGLRGMRMGGIQVSEKHANFLMNVDNASFADVVATAKKIRSAVPAIEGIEMRLYGNDGHIVPV